MKEHRNGMTCEEIEQELQETMQLCDHYYQAGEENGTARDRSTANGG